MRAHGGEWLGTTALIAFMPDQRTDVVMLLNASNPPVSSELSLVGYELLLIALGVAPENHPANSEDFLGWNQHAVVLFLRWFEAGIMADVTAGHNVHLGKQVIASAGFSAYGATHPSWMCCLRIAICIA